MSMFSNLVNIGEVKLKIGKKNKIYELNGKNSEEDKIDLSPMKSIIFTSDIGLF